MFYDLLTTPCTVSAVKQDPQEIFGRPIIISPKRSQTKSEAILSLFSVNNGLMMFEVHIIPN